MPEQCKAEHTRRAELGCVEDTLKVDLQSRTDPLQCAGLPAVLQPFLGYGFPVAQACQTQWHCIPNEVARMWVDARYVFIASGRWCGGLVAVKIVAHNCALASLAEVLRESALSTSIQHPNVVSLLPSLS